MEVLNCDETGLDVSFIIQDNIMDLFNALRGGNKF